jgi:hypothetical protein
MISAQRSLLNVNIAGRGSFDRDCCYRFVEKVAVRMSQQNRSSRLITSCARHGWSSAISAMQFPPDIFADTMTNSSQATSGPGTDFPDLALGNLAAHRRAIEHARQRRVINILRLAR